MGILTQYQPLVLNEYIGNGQPWDLDRLYGGVHVLPPTRPPPAPIGTRAPANAIYQNINFIDRYEPEYVVILSGDHIYKMDYAKMLDFHKEKQARLHHCCDGGPWEASRFGIMTANDDGAITKFEEKPQRAQVNLASMGIYIFTWEKLRRFWWRTRQTRLGQRLRQEHHPRLLAAGERMAAFRLKATGRTWAPLTACGRPTWTC